MKPLWAELSDAINPQHLIGFSIRGEDISHRCVLCGATFPQTDDGWKSLKQHGFDAHEEPMGFDWRELHGKQVTIGVVERQCEPRWGQDSPGVQIDLLARDDDGVIYFLPDAATAFTPDYMRRGMKCKPKSAEHSLLKRMPPAPVSPSNG